MIYNDDPFLLALEAYNLHAKQESNQALILLDQVLNLEPAYERARYLKGIILLSLGKYTEGWPLYIRPSTWQGEWTEELVTLWDDQGYGDFIQFARYIPLVKERCPNLQIIVKDSLINLMRNSFPDIVFAPYSGPVNSKLCPITNLGHVFESIIDKIPNKIPYLVTNSKSEKQASIGICWSTENTHVERYGVRCIPDSIATTLLVIPDSISLQYKDLKKGSGFDETAAVINSLDLVITIDTSIAHLAGALGKETWLLLSHDCDWRWMQQKTYTPWYPTMELIRQQIPGDWKEVINRVMDKISK